MPLNVSQLLWVNLIMEAMAALGECNFLFSRDRHIVHGIPQWLLA